MRKLLLIVSLALLAWAALVVPLPLLVLSPVPAQPVTSVFDMPIPPDEVLGKLLFTVVQVRPATAVTGLAAWPDPYRDVIVQGQVVPAGVDPEQFAEHQRRVFAESLRIAAAVGMREAGLPVNVDGDGARVLGLLPDAPAEGELQTGDVIIAANGEPVRLASDLVAAVAQVRPGDAVRLTVLRDEERLTVDVPVRILPQLDQAGLGVAVSTVDQRIDLPIAIDVEAGNDIGGASAGLMMALAVYDRVEPGDLTGGRVIAGTGTVDSSGRVGRISGVAEKVRGAQLAGARIFLAPDKQAEEARRAATEEMAVIGVDNVRDAIGALKAPKSGGTSG
ncbi:MAG: PDZ domain-containing protein [Actinomycetota bacterium]|nr:PDZ domain-containing protein [Actinomycetota bacterium]